MPEFDSAAASGPDPTEGAETPASELAADAASATDTATSEVSEVHDAAPVTEVSAPAAAEPESEQESDSEPAAEPQVSADPPPEPVPVPAEVEADQGSERTEEEASAAPASETTSPAEAAAGSAPVEATAPASPAEAAAGSAPVEATALAAPEEAAAPAGEVVPPIVLPEPVVMQVLGGIVTAVDSKEVALTLDDGRAAVIHRENFDLAGTDPTTVLQVGDGSEGAVLSREDPQDRVVLSRKWVLRDRAWKKASECVKDHSNMHVKVTSVSKKGIVVDVMGLRGFVPLTHYQLEPTAPPADLVGEMLELRVIAADRQKDKLLLSRRSALLKEQRKAEAEALQNLKVGSVMPGKVVDLTQFGAFVEVGPESARVRGLLHVSEMSWERIGSPKGHVKVGDEIDVKVIEVKIKKKRVSFSRKELIDDPLAGIEVGSIHTGKVKRLVDYGVFVDIGPAEGMVHLSELAEYRPSHPSEIVLRGDEVQVKVLKVNRQKRRVELSMRQALYPS